MLAVSLIIAGNMRAVNKNVILPFSALFLLLAFLPLTTHAQTFGGSSSSTLYSNSSSSIFQAPGGANQGGVSAQGSNAALLQTKSVTVLAVTGAPAAQAQREASDNFTDSNEIIILSIFAGVFALGVLALLGRQVKKSY